MRLMFASHSSDLAGAELCLVVLIQEAVSRGHTGLVTIPRTGPLSDLLSPYKDHFPVVVLPVRPWMGKRYSGIIGVIRLVQALFGSFSFYRLMRKNDFDVIVINSSVIPAPLLAAKIKCTKSLLIVRESILSNPTLRSILPRRLIRRLLSAWATKAVSNSQYIASQYHFDSDVVYPELAPAHFQLAEDGHPLTDSRQLRAVMLGTLSPEKGQLDAVEAVAIARSHGARIRLDIYGHGSDKDMRSLQGAIAERDLGDLIRIHSPTRTPRDVFTRADFSIVCSKNEAFGMVTAESVLAGTPVIGYDRGGTSEILAHGGGLLVEADSTSLAASLIIWDRHREVLRTLRHECLNSQLRDLLIASPASMLDILEELGGSLN